MPLASTQVSSKRRSRHSQRCIVRYNDVIHALCRHEGRLRRPHHRRSERSSPGTPPDVRATLERACGSPISACQREHTHIDAGLVWLPRVCGQLDRAYGSLGHLQLAHSCSGRHSPAVPDREARSTQLLYTPHLIPNMLVSHHPSDVACTHLTMTEQTRGASTSCSLPRDIMHAALLEHMINMRRCPGHVLPVSDFTGESLDEGSDLLEWGTSAFSVMACKRPLYLQVNQRTCSIPKSATASWPTRPVYDMQSPLDSGQRWPAKPRHRTDTAPVETPRMTACADVLGDHLAMSA